MSDGRHISMEEVFPILDVEDDVLVSVGGDLTAAYAVAFPEVFSVPSDGYDKQYDAWLNVLRSLRPHMVLHLQSWYDVEEWTPDPAHPVEDRMDSASDRHFRGRRCLRSESYLFLTMCRPAGDRHTAMSCPMVHRNLTPDRGVLRTSEFEKCLSEVEAVLVASGCMTVERLHEADILGTPATPGLLDRHLTLDRRGSLILEDITLDDGLRIGASHTATIVASSPSEFPETACISTASHRYRGERLSQMSAAGVGLHFPHVTNLYISIPDPTTETAGVEARMRHMLSLGRYSTRNRTAAEHMARFLRACAEGGNHPVRVHFDTMVWNGDRTQVGRDADEAAASLRMAGFTPHRATVAAPVLYWASIPGAEGFLPTEDTFPCTMSAAAALLPSESTVRTSTPVFGIRLADRLTGQPVTVDLSDGPMRSGRTANRNKFVLGPSGTGKSFFMNHMLRQYYCQGAQIVVIDCGHSYRQLADHVASVSSGRDGRYITYGEETECLTVNPFATTGDGYDLGERESLLRLLAVLYKRDGEVLTRAEEVALANAVTAFSQRVAAGERTPSFTSFHAFMADEYAAVLAGRNTRERDFDLRGFLDITSQFAEGGRYASLLNPKRELGRDCRFTVYDLEAAKDSPTILAVLATLVMEEFIRMMRRDDGVRKVIVIDEAWKAISSTVMAEYMKYLYRTVRKHFGEAVTVTQDLDDLIGSPTVRDTIVNNSDCRIVTDARRHAARMDLVTSSLGIPATAADRILSLNTGPGTGRRYREVWIGLGGGEGTVYGVEVSEEEYAMYTTEPTDRITRP